MYSTPEMRIDFPEDEKFHLIDKFKESMAKNLDPSYELVTVDGVRVETKTGWALVRASNTQPALTIRFEANSEDNLAVLMNYIQKELNKVSEKICIF